MMRKVFIFLVALMGGLQVMASSIVIERVSGADMLQDVAVIGKWVFVGSDLQLLDKAGNVLATEAIANVRKITFSQSSTAVEDVTAADILVYPNPTQDVLYVQGIEAQTLRVYDLQGRVVVATEGTEVNVAPLSMGTYLLQVGTQVVRFIKQYDR